MELFIGNLPARANLGELIASFKGFSSKARFRIEQKKREDGTTIRYVVADFDNDKYAEKFIEKYNGSDFHGQALVVREYFHRSYNNERRAVNWREKPWRAGERRRQERRHKEAVAQKDDNFDEMVEANKAREKKEEDDKVTNLKVEAYANVARKD